MALLATCFQADFLLGLFFDPEDGGDMFLRNVGLTFNGLHGVMNNHSCENLKSYKTSWKLGPTQPPSQWAQGAVSPGVKRQGRDADHSPPTSAEVKNM
jgi:hypothetical protein